MRCADFWHQIRFSERHSSKEYHRTGEVDITVAVRSGAIWMLNIGERLNLATVNLIFASLK
jgi:hypothetical protein